ncbi:hypothetical protein ACOMHN_024182 [Nucella lapillus]
MYGDTVYLDCTSSGCKGRAIIKDNRLSHQHSHPPLADDYFTIVKAKSVMKRKAEESASSLRDIYDATVRGEGVAGLLTYRNMESTMSKRRRKTYPPVPRNPDQAAQMLSTADPDVQPFSINFIEVVRCDGGVGLLFMDAGREMLRFFENYQGPLFADGTFFVTPQPFDSLLTIHLDFQGHTFPVFYFLLTSKSEVMYKTAFRKVIDLLPQSATITHTMTDFERPLMNACHEVTGRPVHGCWFHYSQALFRRIHKLGLLHPFRRVTSFKRLIHKYMALPLLPSTRIEEGLDELKNEAPQIPPENQRKLELFRRYVRSFWIQKVTPSRMTVFGLSRRSNNSIENFHTMLKRKIGVAHPNFYVFIDHLNKVIESKLTDLKSLDSGMTAKA